MDVSEPVDVHAGAHTSAARKLLLLAPVSAALTYPYLLKGFHLALVPPDGPTSIGGMTLAAICLLGAFAAPVLGLVYASRLSRTTLPSSFELRARRLAYLTVAAPPLFVFTGVSRGLLGGPLSDEIMWISGWLAAGAFAWAGRPSAIRPTGSSNAAWRVAHGVSAALIACFVLFHLTNHLYGWMGPDVHKAIMETGRAIYRAPLVEPVLVALLLFQAVSGTRLAWRRSTLPADTFRVLQIGSGAYLAAFIVAHLNSALVSARSVRNIETDWAWATGAPGGLIYDAWNIRLLPHYAFGVFFVLAHLSSGLRQILKAHGVDPALANRAWLAGLVAGGLISIAIASGLLGARIPALSVQDFSQPRAGSWPSHGSLLVNHQLPVPITHKGGTKNRGHNRPIRKRAIRRR